MYTEEPLKKEEVELFEHTEKTTTAKDRATKTGGRGENENTSASA